MTYWWAKSTWNIRPQVGPVEVSFDSGGESKHLVGERQVRSRTVENFDSSRLDALLVRLPGCSNTCFRRIQTVNLALRGDCSQFVNGPASAATDIENRGVAVDRNMLVNYAARAGHDTTGTWQPPVASPIRQRTHLVPFSTRQGTSLCDQFPFTMPSLLRASVRRHRSIEQGRCARRSIRPNRATL